MDLSPYRRRNPFAPYDPNDPQDATADQGVYGPSLGPAGGPPPAQASQMYTPPPTSVYQPAPPPQTDRLQAANAALYGPSDQGEVPGQGRRTNIAGDPLPQIPEPPQEEPLPTPGIFEPNGQYAARLRQVQARNKHAWDTYNAQLKLYENQTSARTMYGSYGPGRTPQYVRGEDGKIHIQRFDPTTNSWVTSPEEAVIPQAEAAGIRADARPTTPFEEWRGAHPDADVKDWFAMQPSMYQADRAPVPDQPVYGYDEQGRQEIKYWENPVTHRRTPAPAGATGVRNPPRAPGGPAIDRGDPRREQFIKEYLRQNPGDEEGLTEQLAIYDRGNSPAVRKGRQLTAAQPLGQPHPPLGGAARPPGAETPESIRADFKAGKITREQAKQKLAAFGYR